MTHFRSFRASVVQFVVPMLNATAIDPAQDVYRVQRKSVSLLKGQTVLGLMAVGDVGNRVVLKRSQPFTKPERGLCEHFVDEFERLIRIEDPDLSDLRDELHGGLGTRIVASYFPAKKKTVRKALDVLRKWASETYEGRAISACIGIKSGRHTETSPELDEISDRDFIKVLSNGYDTILTINGHGRITGLERMEHRPSAGEPIGTSEVDTVHSYFAPFRMRRIAQWASGTNIAIVLNQLGQLSVFSESSLLFSTRAGEWLYFAHSTTITKMGPSRKKPLKAEVYLSCLDTSFARVGGCIAVLSRNVQMDMIREKVASADLIEDMNSEKSELLATIIRGRTFQQLSRPIRLELMSMDGATIIDHDGKIVAVGAIVRVPPGSSGGGRRAAAHTLSQLGMAIKVSADGGITGFHKGVLLFEA